MKKLIALALVLVMVFAMVACTGKTKVTIEVVDSIGTHTGYEVRTDAEFLKGAMDDAKDLTYGGIESEFGMMVDTVNGETADWATNGAYWAFYVNGNYCEFGIEQQPIADGDVFLIEYTAALPE